MSIDISQVPALVARDAYPAMFQAYAAEPAVYPLITDVHTAEPGMLGDKGSVFSSVGDLVEVLDGEEIQADTIVGTRTWRIAVKRYARRLDIPKRMLEASDAAGKVSSLLTEFASQWGKRSVAVKEQLVADVFQKGTIAAGNATVFNGSFANEADVNAGFIYDGKPFFAASGNGHPLLAGSTTGVNLVASQALTSANLQTVLTLMRTTNAIDDRELKIAVRPSHLLIPPGLEFTARALLNSTLIPGSSTNDVNVVNGALTPIVWRYLTDDTDAWWTGALGQGGGVRVYDSGAPTIETFYDVKTKTMVVTAEFSFGVGVTDWRQWHASNKATS